MAKAGWFTDPTHGFCKALAGHRWSFGPGPRVVPEKRYLKLTLECDNCEAVRVDRMHPTTGAIMGRTYHYAKGYVFALKGEKRPDKGTLRLEYVSFLRHEGWGRKRPRSKTRRRA